MAFPQYEKEKGKQKTKTKNNFFSCSSSSCCSSKMYGIWGMFMGKGSGFQAPGLFDMSVSESGCFGHW